MCITHQDHIVVDSDFPEMYTHMYAICRYISMHLFVCHDRKFQFRVSSCNEYVFLSIYWVQIICHAKINEGKIIFLCWQLVHSCWPCSGWCCDKLLEIWVVHGKMLLDKKQEIDYRLSNAELMGKIQKKVKIYGIFVLRLVRICNLTQCQGIYFYM